MVSFTFYGGAKEIGGNKILLEENGAKVYLDFGQPFDFGEGYFVEEKYLKPYDRDGLAPFFELGMIPKIPKLYSEAMLMHTDLSYKKPDIDAVFITHHHSDHTGELKFLDESIPVYMGHGTHAIMDAYAHLYASFAKYGEHDIREFKSGDRIDVKGLAFRPIHVEHSTPGAYGYVIEKDGGNIVFTGDLRMHGQMAEMTEEFVKEAEKANPTIMLCEGTRLPFEGEVKGMSKEEAEAAEKEITEKEYTEEEVKKKVSGVIDDSKGLVFAHFAMCNIDRFRSIWEAATENNRKLVIDPKYAYILDCLRDKIDWLPKTDDLCLYYRLNSDSCWDERGYVSVWRDYYGGELGDEWFNVDCNGKRSRKRGMWRCEADMKDCNITFKDLREKPEDYVLFINISRLVEMAHIRPENADYIYSSSEHFLEGEENYKMKTAMNNWLEHFDITLHKAHCSGHAAPSDIKKMVKRVKPDTIIPIHTLNPEKFKDFCGDIRIVGQGEDIGDFKLKQIF
jgi:ribonuclease J